MGGGGSEKIRNGAIFGAPDFYKGLIDPRGGQARSPGLDGHPGNGDYVTVAAGTNVNKSDRGSHFAP